MAEKWAIWLAIDGDLRFLSHHDAMRLIERVSARGKLPIRYSRGYNPRPIFSLPMPRATGVATDADLLVLETDEPIAGDELLSRLNAASPQRMRFTSAQPLAARKPPQPVSARYETDLDPAEARAVRARVDELAARDDWPVERRVSSKRRGKGKHWTTRTLDLRPLVSDLGVAGETLRMTLVRQGDTWARPGEVLALAGLDERIDLARTARKHTEYEF